MMDENTAKEIMALIPDFLEAADGRAIELLEWMKEAKEFYDEKAAYIPPPKPEIISRKVKKTTVARAPMVIFFDDED